MRVAVAILAVIGLVAASSTPSKETKFADKEFLTKQKFLLEIVYRVEDPMMFEEYIKLGKTFTYNKDDYMHLDDHVFMDNYYKAYKLGVTLPKGEFFAAMVSSHYEQLHGLFEFFYYAKNWEIFQRNVCWARLHANEAMFVHALTMAVLHRDDLKGLMLPTIFEIFPQYFFNSKLVYQAEKFDYDTWSKYTMYEKEFKDIMYKDYTKYFNKLDNYDYFYTKDFKTWQWWKLMGLGEHWYPVDRFMVRDNVDHFNRYSKFLDIIKEVKMFWMPVDYTRDIEFYNKESELSYFTEDVEWNSFWYYLNMRFTPYMISEPTDMVKDRHGEFFFYILRQLLTRYYLERLSHGYGEIPLLSLVSEVECGYDPQLIHYNGVGFSYRENYFQVKSCGNTEYAKKITDFLRRMDGVIGSGYYTLADGKTIDMRQPESAKYLANMMFDNVDKSDQYFATCWYMFAHMYLGGVENEKDVLPNILLNYETMMRDPLFYMLYKRFSSVFFNFHSHIKPYTQEELLLPGVQINDVKVSKLITFFDLYDFDVTNLLSDKMKFVDGKFIWDKTLLARQMRLNHKPFEFDYSIESDKDQTVVIRAFIGPKYDEFGQVLSLSENRENFLEFDIFLYELKSGLNQFKRSSKDFSWATNDRTTYTEMYKFVMLAYEGKYEYPLDFAEDSCGFPERLFLTRGWEKGRPMQFLFFISPATASSYDLLSEENGFNCGNDIRHSQYVDDLPFGYPLDREINEADFYVPNMYFMDTKIYHEDIFEKYYSNKKYEKFGTFDYDYYNNNFIH